MSESLKRTLLMTLTLALLCALPALAAEAPQPPATPAAVAGCTFDAGGLFGDLSQPARTDGAAVPAWLDLAPQAKPTPVFHRFCRCSCTHIPNCNTSADCGGSPCLAGITCC